VERYVHTCRESWLNLHSKDMAGNHGFLYDSSILKAFRSLLQNQENRISKHKRKQTTNWIINEGNWQVDGANKVQDQGEKVNQPTKHNISRASREVNSSGQEYHSYCGLLLHICCSCSIQSQATKSRWKEFLTHSLIIERKRRF